MRCHAQSNDSGTHYVPGRLRVLNGNGDELGVLTALYNTNNLGIKPNPDRGNIRDSYAYELPVEWTGVGQLQLQCLVNYPQTISEKDYTDNIAVADGGVRPAAGADLRPILPRPHPGWYRLQGTTWEGMMGTISCAEPRRCCRLTSRLTMAPA